MKRKRLILTAGLLLCVATVVVGSRREIWFAVAYESKSGKGGFVYLEKRWSWLQGKELIARDQLCPRCGVSEHSQCYNIDNKSHANVSAYRSWYLKNYADGSVDLQDANFDWLCTCRDQSHICWLCSSVSHADCLGESCVCSDPSHKSNP